MRLTRGILILLAAAIVPACGGGGGGGGGGSAGTSAVGGGGNATGDGAAVQNGGDGGDVLVFSMRDLVVGGNNPPRTPNTPAVHSTVVNSSSLNLVANSFTTVNSATAFTQGSGDIIISGAVVTGAGPNYTITSDRGDIYVSGSITFSSPGAGNTLTLVATNGAVYVSGSISTASNTAGTAGGNLVLAGGSIIVRGNLITRGAAGGAVAGTDGGSISIGVGGTGTDAYVLGATLDTSGGTGIDGGNAGAITISAASAPGGFAHVISARLTALGGAGTGTDTVLGGNGGTVTINGPSGASVNATMNLTGGRATASGDTAGGGNGGSFVIPNTTLGPVEVYGTLQQGGGSASAATGPVGGGNGGDFLIGDTTTAPTSVELGLGNFNVSGGNGTTDGGNAGAVRFETNVFGSIDFRGTVTASAGTGPDIPGSASTINIVTEEGNIIFSGTLTGLGGSSTDGANPPTAGASVNLICGAGLEDEGNITFKGTINVTGGPSVAASTVNCDGGDGGAIIMRVLDYFNGQIDVLSGSSITADGGRATGNGVGGNGGILRFESVDNEVFIAGIIHASGGAANGTNGVGGDGGVLTIDTDTDNIFPSGDIRLAADSTVTLDGGSASGTGSDGGDGGVATATFATYDGAEDRIELAGDIFVRGGNGVDLGGAGGVLDANSADNAGATLGTITTLSTFLLNASGGNGAAGGDARNDGVAASVTNNLAQVAARLQAGGGAITVAGTVIARGGAVGGAGGDLLAVSTGTIDTTAVTVDQAGTPAGDSLP